MLGTTTTGMNRGQAYTLEGLIGSIAVLMAVLLALQSVVIMPTTGGTVSPAVQAQFQQETKDMLIVTAQDGDLSEAIRNWGGNASEWNEDAKNNKSAFYGTDQPDSDGEWTYSADAFANQSTLGEILQMRFSDRGRSYNVELVANHNGTFETTRMVYQGAPPPDASTASYTVTLYEDDVLTAPTNRDQQIPLETAYTNNTYEYPIPPAADSDGPVYNVVEVRVTVW